MTFSLKESGRVQPQACELEEAVLGALMLEKDTYALVDELLIPQSFYDKTHELIFVAIRDLAIKQAPVDILTVIEQLRKNGTLKDVGGVPHIIELSQKVISSVHLEYHARIVAQKSLARQLISFSSNITNKAFDETIDVNDLIQEAESQLFKISQQNIKKDFTHVAPVIRNAINVMKEVAKRSDNLTGLSSGFTDLDKITFGWQNSDLIIIAGRPSMGKTAFVLSMVKNMGVTYNVPVAIFSLEMSNIQLINRLIVDVTEIDSNIIKSGKLQPYEWLQLEKKIKILYDSPIFVDDTPSLSVFEFRTKARRLVKDHNVKCVIIDYLQLMNASGINFSNREQEVSIISRSLKSLAKELNIPIIALSQLNRNVESRAARDSLEAKRPQLSDLRESGAIEQDADVVCFIHRPEKYSIFEDAMGNDLRGKAEIVIAKHRNGSTGNIMLSFNREYIRFQNLNEAQAILEYKSRLDGHGNFHSNDDTHFNKYQTKMNNNNKDFPF